MTRTEILDRLAAINIWSKGSQHAPYKPLLLLMGLARCSRGEPRVRGSVALSYGPFSRQRLRGLGQFLQLGSAPPPGLRTAKRTNPVPLTPTPQ